MGASLALAGVTACTRQPEEAIVPYVRQPEELVPGKPLFFATAMPFAGSGVGLLVESHEGRPTKIEGNPDHPSSLGATDLFAQAAILGLYDPDRSQTINHLGEIRTFDSFALAMQTVLAAQQGSKGTGIRILTETVASPTLGAQLQQFLTRFLRRLRRPAVRDREGRRHSVARCRLPLRGQWRLEARPRVCLTAPYRR
jgi:molybdopterin-containing oxidoreductase family iron-sulfur binding subunit